MMHTLKRLIKLGISAGYFLYLKIVRALWSWSGKNEPGSCVVLAYHGVAAECRASFAKQMDILLQSARPISTNHVGKLQAGQSYAAVTFDDGFRSLVENAIPELVSRAIPATIFVVTDLLGSRPGWMTFDDDRIDSEKIMSADELRSLPEKLISVGSHTLSHPWLPDLPQPQAQWELAESRTALGDLLGREVRLFSFPYGAFDDKLLDLCRVAGYSRVFTTVPSSSPLGQAFVVGRVRVDPADWTWEFRLKLSGAYQWLPLAFALKRKIMCRLNSRLQVDALGMNTCPVPSNARKDYE